MVQDANQFTKEGLTHSYQNCLTFTWIKERIQQKNCLSIYGFLILKKRRSLLIHLKIKNIRKLILPLNGQPIRISKINMFNSINVRANNFRVKMHELFKSVIDVFTA